MQLPDSDFSRLFDASPNPYLVLDRSLNIVAANRAYLAATQRELPDILGRWAWDAFPAEPEKVALAVASFEQVIRTKQPVTLPLLRFDIPRSPEDGGGFEERYWSITETPVLDATGEVAYVLQNPIDVTELEQLRDAAQADAHTTSFAIPPEKAEVIRRAETVQVAHVMLKDESDRLRTLFAQAPNFMCVLRGSEHRFEMMNAAYRQLVGHRDMIGLTVREALPELEGQVFFDLLDGVYASAEPFVGRQMKLDMQRVPGAKLETRYVDFVYQPLLDDQGRPNGIFVQGVDVTDAKLAVDELAEREERLRLVVEGAKDHAIITTDPEGIITGWSSGAAAIFGWSSDEAIDSPAALIFTPEDRDAGIPEKELRTALVDGSSPDQRWHLCKDGCRVFMNGSVHPLPLDAQGKPQGFMKIARDETERRRMDEDLHNLNATLEQRVEERTRDLRTAEEQLRQAQKMEAVGQLTGGLAHDFNNLLTAVTGGLDLLGLRLARGEYDKLDRYINMAQSGANRAAALTQRLLAFSRRQTLAPKPTDVDRLIAGMEEIIDRTIGPAIEVKVVSTVGLWQVLVDAPQLENALLNLCINARDAMPQGGRLTIETGNKTLDARAAAAQDLPEGDYLSLCVTDTGTGMTPEIISRVFDPFFTTKPIGEGTGLGLSMIYGFVRQSGGQVRIYSEVGQGTTMCLYLPRLVGAHDIDAAGPGPATRHRAEQGQTVLLVEDEVAIRDLVSDILVEAGYRVLTASNGPMGVALLQSAERIDLLVTDVGLPGGLNGRQVADAGRVARPELKVLFVTGYAANAAVGAGHMDQGMEVLTKPFNVLELERRVGDMIAG